MKPDLIKLIVTTLRKINEQATVENLMVIGTVILIDKDGKDTTIHVENINNSQKFNKK